MNILNNITISNYKSLQQVCLNGCRQYNLLIGRPNVGKSNILEALALFQLPYFSHWKINANEALRIDSASSLFYLGDIENNIEIKYDNSSLSIAYSNKKTLDMKCFDGSVEKNVKLVNMIPDGAMDGFPQFRSYNFSSLGEHDDDVELPFLCPLNACNISQVIKGNKQLYDYVSELLGCDSLSLVFDTGRQDYVIMKKVGEDKSLILPLKALADSLLRLIYYKTAILSNKNAVLIMEEPESHTYPPYISKMVHDVMECRNNQFFIATHSPYVVNEFLQEKADVALYIVDAVDGNTVVKRLSNNELSEVYEYGIDLFFNTESFLA